MISVTLDVGEEQIAPRKVAVSGEDARAKMHRKNTEKLPRKAVWERWAVN